MNGETPELQPNVITFPMKHPEMQIGEPEQAMFPDLPIEREYARSTQTWD